MNKYILHGCIIMFLIIVGVGVVSEINNSSNVDKEVSSFEENIENGNEIQDGYIENVRVEKEDTSNLISDINARVAAFVVESLNSALKVVIEAISSITN